jgi:hypothetical protein
MSRDSSAKRCSICSTRESIIAIEGTRAALLAAVLAAALLLPSSASAGLLDIVNQQRSANGLPTVTERPDWSQACVQHIAYEAAHYEVTHDEDDTTSPTWSTLGAWAGENSVLAYEADWNVGSPWYDAPIHLQQFLTPLLKETGLAQVDGFQCAIIDPGYTRKVSPTAVYTYPGDGVRGVGTSEVADEEPTVPGEYVGLKRGQRTGPSLLVWTGKGPAEIESASLRGPHGPVKVRWIDNTTPDGGDYLTPGGIIIPVSPLELNAGYIATVRIFVGGRTLAKTWSFGTGTAAAPALSAESPKQECRTLRLRLKHIRDARRITVRDSRLRKLRNQARAVQRQIAASC